MAPVRGFVAAVARKCPLNSGMQRGRFALRPVERSLCSQHRREQFTAFAAAVALSGGLSACGGGLPATTTMPAPQEECEAADGRWNVDMTCTSAAGAGRGAAAHGGQRRGCCHGGALARGGSASTPTSTGRSSTSFTARLACERSDGGEHSGERPAAPDRHCAGLQRPGRSFGGRPLARHAGDRPCPGVVARAALPNLEPSRRSSPGCEPARHVGGRADGAGRPLRRLSGAAATVPA